MTAEPVDTQIYDPLTDTPTDGLYEKYEVLRDRHPVYYNPVRDAWCLSRYDDIFHADRDWQTFSNAHGVDLDVPARFLGAGDFLDNDPPLHDYLRNVVQGWFTPVAVRTLVARIDRRVTNLLDNLEGEVDLAHDFAWQIPIWLTCTILGIPTGDLAIVKRWLTELTERTPGADTPPPEGLAALDSLHTYFAGLATERCRHPADDLLTTLGQAVDSKELTMDELLGTALLLFVAGSETTASLISSALFLLDSHPTVQQSVRTGDLGLAAVIDEILRYESPIQYLCRTTTRETTASDTVLPQGARVVLLYGSANRDGHSYEAANVFDPYRPRKPHLAFGHGIHACLGAPLARLEGEIALRRFLERVAGYEITGRPTRMKSPNVRVITRLTATLMRA